MAASTLSHARLKAFSGCLNALYEEAAEGDPLAAILKAIESLVPHHSMMVDKMRLEDSVVTHVMNRNLEAIPDLADLVPSMSEGHPGVLHILKHGFTRVLSVSDFITVRQFRETNAYHCLRPALECKDQSTMTAHLPGGIIGFCFNRDRVFTAEEKFMMELFQPHIERVLDHCALYARLPANSAITAREREVLHWMTKGKQDDEIAGILGTSVRTVNQHVHNILAKLGVENRTSAVAMVLGGSN